MIWSRFASRLALPVVLAAGISLAGCSSGGGEGGRGGSSATGNGGSGGSPGAGGASAGTAGGAAGTTGAAGEGRGGATAANGGSGGSAAGTTGSAGSPAAGAGGGAGQGGSAGGSATGGRGGGAGETTGGGGSGLTPIGKGSAGKFVCAGGTIYPPNPLTGMGTVAQIAETPPDYFAFVEGTIWVASQQAIFFSDNVSPEKIWKVVPPATMATKFLTNSGSNGMAVDNDDNLLVADQEMKRIYRLNASNAQTIGSAISLGSAKPNDLIYRSDGNIYVTDPDSGFYRISPTGTVGAAMKQVGRPNGVALSPDENTLYVGDVSNKMIAKFPVAADGTVGTMAPFVTTMSGTADGMCVDCAGNVYVSTADGVEVYAPAGTYIGKVPTGMSSNCTFGGADRRTLYVASQKLLKYVTLGIPGLPD
jgi:gluconolactonase